MHARRHTFKSIPHRPITPPLTHYARTNALQVEDPQTHQGRMLALVRSYLLPQGFPDSVAPQYATYMGWRGVQYFFGGAMSVFTTKCLLSSLGVAGRHSVGCRKQGCVGSMVQQEAGGRA